MKEVFEKEELLEKSNLKRIDHTYISQEISHILHWDRGFFLTVKELFLRPGKTVRKFLQEDRNFLVKPVLFLIICAVVFALTIHSFHLNLVIYSIEGELFKGKIRSKEIGEWTAHNTGYAQLILGVFIAFWIKIFFKKFNYNIYEILVLLSFILGEALLIMVFFIITTKIFNLETIFTIGKVFYFLYIIWGIGQFFGEKKLINYFKAGLSYSFVVVTYMLILTLLAYLLTFI